MLVKVETDGPVRVIRMDNGENRFNRPFLDELNRALDEIEKDRGAGAVIFTGAHEKYFSNGLDLQWIVENRGPLLLPFLLDFTAFLQRVFLYPKPVIAAMNGHAYAGGMFLAMAADYRVMRSDRGWLCIPEIDIGLDLPPGYVAILEYVAGTRLTGLLSLSGKRLTGAEAFELKLVDELVPQAEVMPRAMAAARDLVKKNPAQYARIKAVLRRVHGKVLAEEDPVYIRTMFKEKKFAE